MSISIVCDSCHSTFNVSEGLAGKKVKCRNCGGPIIVPGFEGLPTGANECLSCGKPMAAGSRICTACGFNPATGQKEATLLELEVGEADAARKKKRRWVRARGNPLLETLDQFFKLIVVVGLVAGLVISGLHFFNVPGGFAPMDLLPLGLVLLLLGAVMAPLVTFGINFTVRQIKFAPRDDTYSRVLLCVLLPLIAAMIAGWPESAAWSWIVTLAWLAGVLLLVYFFRADVVEWIASVTVAIVAIMISVLAVNLAVAGVTLLTGPLYGDMLPGGPWGGLAAGHSPAPEVISTNHIASSGGVGPTTSNTTGDVTGAATTVGPTSMTAGGPATSIATPATVSPTTHMAPTKLASLVLTDIDADPQMIGVRDIIASSPPGDYFLAVRDSETTTAVERWSMDPRRKKEEANYPLFAKKPPQFALSPRNDVMVALQFFPRSQIEVTTFDNKTPPRGIAPSNPEGTPTLLGFLDERNFCIRWDLNGATVIEIESTTGQQVRHFSTEAINPEPAASVLSPNGKILAAVGRGQILLYSLDSNVPVRRIQASDLPVKLFALAFSPDSSQIAMYAAIDGLPTLLAFKISNGDLAYTGLLSQTAVDAATPIIPHALVWLPSSQTWLINGTDFFDPVTRKRLATLSAPPMIDVQYLGSNTVAFTLRADDVPGVTFAQPDESQLHKK